MSPSQRYGNRVTASTSNPALRKTSLVSSVTCSSHVSPFIFRCSLGRCHLPPKNAYEQNVFIWNIEGLYEVVNKWGELYWLPTDRLPHKAGREAPQPGWASLCWELATAWCPAREAEGRHSGPASSDSWSHHTGNQSAATHLYPEPWARQKTGFSDCNKLPLRLQQIIILALPYHKFSPYLTSHGKLQRWDHVIVF